jgi:hypothetical protein
MPHSPNIDDLEKAGIVASNNVTQDAQKVIDNLTPEELQAIKSVHAKIDSKNQAKYGDMIQILGF